MPLPSLIRREWHILYQFPLAVGLITALNLAVTLFWDWSGWDGKVAFLLNTAWMFGLTVATVAVLFAAGLPLRFIYRANDRWRRRWWLAPCGVAVGVVLCALSFHVGTSECCIEEGPTLTEPNQALSMGGLRLLGFCALHFYIPFERIKKAISGENNQR